MAFLYDICSFVANGLINVSFSQKNKYLCIYFSGPSLPTTCRFPTMVSNPDGHGVILLGCYETQDTLYELKNVDGILTWREMP